MKQVDLQLKARKNNWRLLSVGQKNKNTISYIFMNKFCDQYGRTEPVM